VDKIFIARNALSPETETMGRTFFRVLLFCALAWTSGRGIGATAKMEITEEFVGESVADPAVALLERGIAHENVGHFSRALRAYRRIARHHPMSPEAPEALQRRGRILLRQNRFQAAFRCFQSILDRYPDYPDYEGVVDLEFQTAECLMVGHRNYFWGKVPGFKDRTGAIEFFRQIVDRAPYGDRAPHALMNIAHLGLRIGETATTIDALERIIDEYSMSPLAPEALLMLAKVYRDRVPGPAYDQRAVQEALNCYQEFLILFPDSPQAEEAEAGFMEAMELRAAGQLNMGNFYYDRRQNPRAALPYYEEAIKIAPESRAADRARERISAIGEGKPGRGTRLDSILGRYRPPTRRGASEKAPPPPVDDSIDSLESGDGCEMEEDCGL
jgi:outer membrane protein assembly factor BamD